MERVGSVACLIMSKYMSDKATIQKPRVELKPEAIGSVILGIISILADIVIIATYGDIPYRGYNLEAILC